MKRHEQYKRLIRFLFSFNATLFVVIIYWFVWSGYYNKIVERPFWRKGNRLIVLLHVSLPVFFHKVYDDFKVAYLKEDNLAWSQTLSITFVNITTCIQILLLDQRL